MDLKRSNVTIGSEASQKLTALRKKNRKIRAYDIILSIILVCAGTIFFFTFSNAITSSAWIAPVITFSLYITTFFISALTSGRKKYALIATITSLIPSLLLIAQPLHIASILLATLLVWRSIILIRKGLFSSLKVEAGRALHSGAMTFIIALCFVVASQYYFTIKQYDNAVLVQRVVGSNTSATISITSKILSFFSNNTSSNTEPTTIDSYLKKTVFTTPEEKSSEPSLIDNFTQSIGIDTSIIQGQIPASPQLEEKIRDSLLENTKQQISKNIGINLTGSEKITDVMADLAQIKAQKLVEENATIAGAIPIILTIFIFLALISIGSILRFFWIILAQCVFWLLKFYGVIQTIHIKKDVEVIKF